MRLKSFECAVCSTRAVRYSSRRRSNTTYGRRKLRSAAFRNAKCSYFRKGMPARPSAGKAGPGTSLPGWPADGLCCRRLGVRSARNFLHTTLRSHNATASTREYDKRHDRHFGGAWEPCNPRDACPMLQLRLWPTAVHSWLGCQLHMAADGKAVRLFLHKHGLKYRAQSRQTFTCCRHDWASCICGHKGERANRRDLRTHSYLPIACEYAKQKLECPNGDACPKSHNLFEYWLHPKRYKTEMCLIRADCDRPVCFFAHNADELRTLDPELPPAELCWSAGAALLGKDGSNSSSGGREAGMGYSSRGWAQKQSTQQQYQHYQQQKLQAQLQQAQQVMLSQGQDMSLKQQQQQLAGSSNAAQQQQPVFVQMPSGELAMLAPVGQALQPQHQLVLDAPAQDLAMAFQAGGGAVVAHTQLPGQQGHMPAVCVAAAGQPAPPMLGTFLPIGSTAAAPAAGASQPGAWPQLLLDPLQQQQQCSIYTNSNILQPALQQQGMVAVHSNACSPPSPLYQQTGNYTALVSSSPAAPHLPAGPVYATAVKQQPLGTAASSMISMTAAGGANPAGLAGYQVMQLQPDGLLSPIAAVHVSPNSACSSAVGTGSYATQLGSTLAVPTDLPTPNNLTVGTMYSQGIAGSSQGLGLSQGGVVINAGIASQGFGMVPVSGVDMTALQGALQGLQI